TVTLLYTVVVFITTGVLDSAALDGSLTPITDGAAVFMGGTGILLVSIAAIFAFVSTANAGIMAASRYPLAMARDRLLPSGLGAIGERSGTPHNAILFTGLMIAVFLFVQIDFLIKTASTVLILTFMFSCLSVIIMRESGIQNYRPRFTFPLYPWPQVAGIVLYGLLIVEMGRDAVLSGLALVAGGLFVYWYYGRVRSSREFALLHLIKRITAKELVSRDLEEELKEIIREHDEIVKDRFDEIIENCVVVDIDEPVTVDGFFRIAAEKLAPRLQAEPDEIVRLLTKRERENSTIIAPGLAIPHIIVEGEKTSEILLARCLPGIRFSDKFENITTAFILAGTRDERNFHLRALSAIAQIVHDHKFPKRWRAARGTAALRDVILLGRRKRL
ncbi:MAG: amino acid permease, partial [Candidatus Latescibacteria bacterium]|nr:amino acid permease [Candidatus Latescibacterota bacterium]